MTTIWLDVEDLYEYAARSARPSGIQRLAYELYRVLANLDDPTIAIGFLRHDNRRNTFRIVAWHEVEALYLRLSQGKAGKPDVGARLDGWRLAASAQSAALRHAGRIISTGLSSAAHALARPATDSGFAARVKPGDVVLALGSIWFHPDYPGLIEAAKRHHAIRFGLLVYDMIPLERPEWCEPTAFSDFIANALPAADVIFTISQASADDIARYAKRMRMTLRTDPVCIPVGTGFEKPHELPAASSRLPPGDFLLVVGTIDARKNHALLLRIWRRLVVAMPAGTVPSLVIAGKPGPYFADMMAQLEACSFMEGKIVVIRNPSDADLLALYHGCLLTIFPSFYEGWGLPVTESLALGVPCLASSATSLREAGGALARYFDPCDENAAYETVRRTIEDREGLREWRQAIASEFRPVSWQASADAITGHIRRLQA